MAAPDKYITHIAPDGTGNQYQIVPLALTDGSYLLTPPTLSKDSTMVLTEDSQTLYVSDQSYAYKGKLSVSVGCVDAIVHTGLTTNEIFALTGNRYGQTYLSSDTAKYYRCSKTTTTADSSKWRNVTSAATTSLALPNQLTTEDAIYIRINLNQQYYSQLPRFCVQAGYDNINGTTWITGFCRQQNQFEITSCSYNGNNLLGVYQTTANTNIYVFKFKKYASTYGAANDFTVAPIIYYNEYSGTPTIEFIGKDHADYNIVKAYNYVSVPAYGIKGTAIQQTLIPQANNTYDLGTSGYHWKNAYVNTLVSGNTTIPVANIVTADKYHTDGGWNNLSYTLTGQGGASDIVITLPTGTSSTTLAVGNHTHDYYTKPAGGIPNSDLENSSKYVFTDTTQTITGTKTFESTVTIQASSDQSSSDLVVNSPDNRESRVGLIANNTEGCMYLWSSDPCQIRFYADRTEQAVPGHTYTYSYPTSSGTFALVSQIPTGTAASKDYTTTVTSGSSDLVTSGAVYSAINELTDKYHTSGTWNGLSYTLTGQGGASDIVITLPTGTTANKIPVLDSNGKLPESAIPAVAITDTYVVASESAMLALAAQKVILQFVVILINLLYYSPPQRPH